jgi:hypothetical protein
MISSLMRAFLMQMSVVSSITLASLAVATTIPEPLRIKATGPIFLVNLDLISQVLTPSRIISIHGSQIGIAESVAI